LYWINWWICCIEEWICRIEYVCWVKWWICCIEWYMCCIKLFGTRLDMNELCLTFVSYVSHVWGMSPIPQSVLWKNSIWVGLLWKRDLTFLVWWTWLFGKSFGTRLDINKTRYISHVSYEWVVSPMNESCRKWMSHVANEWVMSQMNESCRMTYVSSLVMSHMSESCLVHRDVSGRG